MPKSRFYPGIYDYIEAMHGKLDLLANARIPSMGIISKVLSHGKTTKEQDRLRYSITSQVESVDIDGSGIVGDRHYREFRLAGGRERDVYPKEDKCFIREQRHIFAVSDFDCNVLSEKVGREITPELLGANLVISREDRRDFSLSQLPLGTYLFIGDANSREMPTPPVASLVMYTKQLGCAVTGNAIAEHYGDLSLSKKFVDAAQDNRGIVLTVEHPYNSKAVLRAEQKVFFGFSTGETP